MDIDQWWPKLKPATREWLIDNNGDAVPAEVVAEIASVGGPVASVGGPVASVGGPVASDAWWVGQSGASGFYIPDAATDWIEAVANGEAPEGS